jgi:hypothetical protein
MVKRVSDLYMKNLFRTVRRPSLELDALTHYWPNVIREFDKKRHSLERKIPKDDPLRLPVDLLTPLNRRSDEILHTRALAYLLDPSNHHGFGKAILGAILQNVKQGDSCCSEAAAYILGLLAGNSVRISVTPEYRYKVDGFRDRSVARPDIWIEVRMPSNAALVVIENKINACESNGQLGWYERKARLWCKHERGQAVSLLIFIAPEQREVKSSDTDEWAVLSYIELAAALRTVWKYKRRAVGRSWLGLYIASITRGLLELDISSSDGTNLAQIQTYLGEAK